MENPHQRRETLVNYITTPTSAARQFYETPTSVPVQFYQNVPENIIIVNQPPIVFEPIVIQKEVQE